MKKGKKILLTLGIILITLIFIFCAMWIERDKTNNIHDYNKYFGENSIYREEYNRCFGYDLGNNSENSTKILPTDIFPKSIPNSAKIEDFCYYYYNPFDPNYTVYLVYTCSDEDFIKETERLSKIDSSKKYLIYGATGFNYPIEAIYANENGYIYCLADKETKKLIYVGINFCDYFSDINYKKIINKKYLPINFDATRNNKTQKKNHQENIDKQQNA